MRAEGHGDVVSVGVDLGGTATRFVLLHGDNRIRRQFIASTPADATKASAVRFLVDSIRDLTQNELVNSIGIGASGPIDRGGVIKNLETLPAFSDIDIVSELESEFRVRPTMDNDAVTAAIGEYLLGAGRSAQDLLLVTLGTGVGVCLLQRGKPFRGSDGQHPEASHLSLTGPGAPCYCGRSRCWEQTASRRALQDAASSLLDDPTASSDDIDRVQTRALAGDPDSLRIFTDFGSALAEGLADLIAVYQPDRVVIGGSGSSYLPGYGPALRDSLERLQGMDVTIVVAAELGEYGGAIGAALAGAA
jgi:glucokinase